ncbi:12033_t:CDS:2, partial [Dentiscutata heterogama]
KATDKATNKVADMVVRQIDFMRAHDSSIINMTSPNPTFNGMFFGIGVAAGIIVIIFLAFAGFLLYRRFKPKYIPTPGSDQRPRSEE